MLLPGRYVISPLVLADRVCRCRHPFCSPCLTSSGLNELILGDLILFPPFVIRIKPEENLIHRLLSFPPIPPSGRQHFHSGSRLVSSQSNQSVRQSPCYVCVERLQRISFRKKGGRKEFRTFVVMSGITHLFSHSSIHPPHRTDRPDEVHHYRTSCRTRAFWPVYHAPPPSYVLRQLASTSPVCDSF